MARIKDTNLSTPCYPTECSSLREREIFSQSEYRCLVGTAEASVPSQILSTLGSLSLPRSDPTRSFKLVGPVCRILQCPCGDCGPGSRERRAVGDCSGSSDLSIAGLQYKLAALRRITSGGVQGYLTPLISPTFLLFTCKKTVMLRTPSPLLPTPVILLLRLSPLQL